MELIALGTGSAFTLKNFQSNYLLKGAVNLLIDCGGDIRFSLKEQNMSYKDIDAVYVSHLHADHQGGLEYLAFCSYFDPSKKKVTLYGHKRVIDELWNGSLRGGLKSIEGKMVNLEDYFDVMLFEDNGSFIFNDSLFSLIQVMHIMDGYAIVPSFGLMFDYYKTWVGDSPNLKVEDITPQKVFLTTDCQFCPEQIKDFYKQADIIIQDCEVGKFPSGVHAHYDKLITLPDEIKGKMYLTHYQDSVLNDFDASQEQALKDGFRGFLRKGYVL
jgi:ribonuclease BN (tRNA processing enzyme)